MSILLTGSGGFLGQRIAERLLARGVDSLDLNFRQASGHAVVERLREAYPTATIRAAPANLLDKSELARALVGVDCIVHAAAQTRGGVADMIANSVVATRNLLEAAAAAGVRRIVLVSSFSVYQTEALSRGALLTESTPTEPGGVDKGGYAYSKIRQEQLYHDMCDRLGIETVVLRPGVIYGPGGGGMSPRVGIGAMGVFFSLGGGVLLPLTYVDNCADAIALATIAAPAGSTFNVVDDDLPSCRRYLNGYRRFVRPLRVVPIPYWALALGARALVRYHRRSKGQLPAVFTPYLVRSMYRPLRYSNAPLKALGWRPLVATSDGLSRTFAWLAAQAR